MFASLVAEVHIEELLYFVHTEIKEGTACNRMKHLSSDSLREKLKTFFFEHASDAVFASTLSSYNYYFHKVEKEHSDYATVDRSFYNMSSLVLFEVSSAMTLEGCVYE